MPAAGCTESFRGSRILPGKEVMERSPVSQSNLPEVRKYIADQKRHHQKICFRDEFIQFLIANEIEFDERYI